MSAVRLILKLIIGLIYTILVAVVLYFPFAQILAYAARETRLFQFQETFQVEDSLLIFLGLAAIYAVISALRRALEPAKDISGEDSKGRADDSK